MWWGLKSHELAQSGLTISITEKWEYACEPRHEISNNVVCATSKGSYQPAHTPSLIRAFTGDWSLKYSMTDKLKYSMSVKLLTE